MNEFLWFAFGIIVGALPLIIALIVILKKRESVNVFDTDDISELIGKIQHVTSVNVDTIERKIIQLKSTVRSANAEYMKLSEAISDAKNLFSKHVSSAFKEERKNAEPGDRTLGVNQTVGLKEKVKARPLTKEEKVLDLKEKNWTVERIAESLNMGVGEVKLIVDLGSHMKKI